MSLLSNSGPTSFHSNTATYVQTDGSSGGATRSITLARISKPAIDNFYTVASIYSHDIGPKLKVREANYSGQVLKHYGAGGFSTAVQLSKNGVGKLPRIAPGEDNFSEDEFYQDLITELRVSLHGPIKAHPNIIKFREILWTAGTNLSGSEASVFSWPTLEFETADGTLGRLLQQRPALTFAQKINLCLDVAEALDCLHACGVIHSDVKSDNVFIFSHPVRGYAAKLADFGCATILGDPDTRSRLSGYTKLWSPPERDEEMGYQKLCRTDLYSFGLMVWQVITDGKTPFEWFSWMDGPVTHDEISAVKDCHCILPLAIEALAEIALKDHEREICSAIFNATLGISEQRADYLSAVIESYWIPNNWGKREFGWSSLWGKSFLGPVPLLDLEAAMRDLMIDGQVPAQIFNSIKQVNTAALACDDGLVVGSSSYQLYLCYYHGYGTGRDIKSCITALATAARYGNSEAQSMITQFYEAHGAEVPHDLPVHGWLKTETLNRTPGAARMLESIDSELHQQAISELRCLSGRVPSLLHLLETTWTDHTIRFGEVLADQNRRGLIHLTATSGNLSMTKRLLDNEVSFLDLRAALYLACKGGHLDVALLLLAQPWHGRTLILRGSAVPAGSCLHWLTSFESRDMIQIAGPLIRHESLHDMKCQPLAEASLRRAVAENNIEAVRVLLAYGAERTYGLMAFAASLRCDEILGLLLNDVAEKEGRMGVTELGVLIHAAASSDTIPSIKLHGFRHSCSVISTFETLESFVQLWHPSPNLGMEKAKRIGLQAAVNDRQLSILQLVLDPFFIDCMGLGDELSCVPLVIALATGDTAVFSLLLEHVSADGLGYYTNERGYKGHNMDFIILKAATAPNPFFIRELLQRGFTIDERRTFEASDLPASETYKGGHKCLFQLAVLDGRFETADFLAKTTMQIETSTHTWNMLLFTVIVSSVHHGFRILDYCLNLRHGPPPRPDSRGLLHSLAGFWSEAPPTRRGSVRKYLAQLLQRLADSINVLAGGSTPLVSSISHHNVLMVEALIDAGADVNVLDEDGFTAIDIILQIRAAQVLRTHPKAHPRTATETPTTVARGDPSLMLPGTNIPMAQTDMIGSILGNDRFNQPYQGDSVDERLDTIYGMLREAGGKSNMFSDSYSCTGTLKSWTNMWAATFHDGIQGQVKDVIDSMKPLRGHHWARSDNGGRVSRPDNQGPVSSISVQKVQQM